VLQLVRSNRGVSVLALGIFLALSLSLVGALAQGGPATVGVDESDVYGAYLVDGGGMSLYLFLDDSPGESACYDACASAWPPLLTEGDVIAAEGVDASLLGTTERTDGTVQVTYGGWPLYTFVRDDAAGDVVGQGVNDVWYLVDPSGEGIGIAASEDEGATFAAFMDLGARVYSRHCAVCHGDEGNQALASHTAILDGYRRLNDASRTVRAIVNGRGYMPAAGADLTDEEVAAVATFVRNSWSNDHGLVSLEEVEAVR